MTCTLPRLLLCCREFNAMFNKSNEYLICCCQCRCCLCRDSSACCRIYCCLYFIGEAIFDNTGVPNDIIKYLQVHLMQNSDVQESEIFEHLHLIAVCLSLMLCKMLIVTQILWQSKLNGANYNRIQKYAIVLHFQTVTSYNSNIL